MIINIFYNSSKIIVIKYHLIKIQGKLQLKERGDGAFFLQSRTNYPCYIIHKVNLGNLLKNAHSPLYKK